MKPKATLIGAVVAAATLALTAPAAVASHHHKPHCASGKVAKRERVRVRRHGVWVHVREWRCVRLEATARLVRYSAKVDPALTQAARNPLAVSYTYSADATSTINGVTTDLASTGQLPAGILNFYSAGQPGSGAPQSLYCSINVGGSATSGTCPVTYSKTGSYSVTTQYIPSSTSAVSQTAMETVSPFSTTTTLSVTPISCTGLVGPWGQPATSTWQKVSCYQLSASAIDQNGNAPPPGPFCNNGCGDAIWLSDGNPNEAAGSITPGAVCSVAVYANPSTTAPWVAGGYSPDCRTSTADVGWAWPVWGTSAPPASWSLAASYQGQDSLGNGANGWASSTSAPQTVTSGA